MREWLDTRVRKELQQNTHSTKQKQLSSRNRNQKSEEKENNKDQEFLKHTAPSSRPRVSSEKLVWRKSFTSVILASKMLWVWMEKSRGESVEGAGCICLSQSWFKKDGVVHKRGGSGPMGVVYCCNRIDVARFPSRSTGTRPVSWRPSKYLVT